MKKLIIGAIAATMLSGTANAVLLGDHFYKYGYTKPQYSLTEIQKKIDNGTFYNYPYISGKSDTGLFEDKLKKGTAIPQFVNGNRLLNALRMKVKPVIVANKGDANVKVCVPVFEELARQNGVSCSTLMTFLVDNQAEGEDMFSDLENTLMKAEQKIMESVNQETLNEIVQEVTEQVTEEISEEVMQEIENVIDFDAIRSILDQAVQDYTFNYGEALQEIENITNEVYLAAVLTNLNRNSEFATGYVTEALAVAADKIAGGVGNAILTDGGTWVAESDQRTR